MQTIWKYPIKVQEEQFVELPVGAKILTVHIQRDIPQLWCFIPDVTEDLVKKVKINIFGTGEAIDSKFNYVKEHYIGTFFALETNLVFHVFCDDRNYNESNIKTLHDALLQLKPTN